MWTNTNPGCAQVISTPISHQWHHRNLPGGITHAGARYRGATVVGFLRHLLQQIKGKILVVWDGAPIHRSAAVREFLASVGQARLYLERLPPYTPELNPDEGIWHYLKNVEFRNVVCETIDELRYELRLVIARLRHKRSVIQGCISHTRL